VLGRVAAVEGASAEAETHLRAALETFGSIPAQFETGRTHLALAEHAHTRGDRNAVAIHLEEAHATFMALRVPNHVRRTEQLARNFDVLLRTATLQ
jgi:hypothetical protein